MDSCTATSERIGWLFNHLVGTDEQCGREGDAQRPGGLEVEDEIELRRLLYRKLARLRALQDLVHIVRRALKQVVIIRRIGNQSARLGVLAIGISRGEPVLDRKLRDAAALAHTECVTRY